MSMTGEHGRDPTPEQRRAIYTADRNLVVVAGAGTGKTFVLVRRFVAMLEANPDWPLSAVVAITFTNRAADEMRARVRQELEYKRRAASDDASRGRWNDLLSQIEAARITTIHGLCSEIVRSNAPAAGVDPRFEVLEDAQAAVLRADAVSLALAEVVAPGALSAQAAALAVHVIARYGESDIRSMLSNAALLDADLHPPRPLEALHAEWERRTELALSSHGVPFLTYIPPDNDDLLAAVSREAFGHLMRFNRPGATIDERIAALEGLTTISLRGGAAKKWPQVNEAKAELKQAREDAERLLKAIDPPPGEQDIEAASLIEGWRVLIDRTRIAYAGLKQSRRVLDYNDLERVASAVLEHPDAAARYVGAEFRHVMVDEFQDTNAHQWRIVRAVARPEQPGSLFIVGDPKQSIYAFRGADVTVFDEARHDIESLGGEVLYLTESFRTHEPLVQALNELFAGVLRVPVDAFEPRVFVNFDEQQRLKSPRAEPPAATYLESYVVPKAGPGHALEREARAVAQRIKSLVRDARPLVYDRAAQAYRPPRYGDIAVLLRSFRGRVELFELALSEERIPFITLGGQGFYGRREVKDLLCALRALHNPADELQLAAALHSPLFAVSDVDLLLLRQPQPSADGHRPRPLPMFDALLAEADRRRALSDDYDPLVFSADILRGLMPMVGRAPVEMLLQALLHETGYMATLSGLPDGLQMRANVEKLVDRARESGLTTLNRFVRYLNDMTEGEAKEGGVPLEADDAVRLTTIHSAKGLEYPIVWIADACAESRGGREGLLNWVDELGCIMPGPDQLPLDPARPDDKRVRHPYVYQRNRSVRRERDRAESLRLLYVAATRARDALFFSGVADVAEPKGWIAQIASALPPAELHVAPRGPRVGGGFEQPPSALSDFPLARTVPAAPPPGYLHLSDGDLTALGGHYRAPDNERDRFTRRLRYRMFSESSEPIALLTYDPDGGLTGRRFGPLLRDALRCGYDALVETAPRHAEAMIQSMAWEAGITQPHDLEAIVDRVRTALLRYRRSRLAAELARSAAVYRDLPFVYRRDGHIIHGVVDLLYRAPDDNWTLVGFKTDWIDDRPEALTERSRRYRLQMAVHAEAVAAQIGTAPRTMLIFLRQPDAPLQLDAAELSTELADASLHNLTALMREVTA